MSGYIHKGRIPVKSQNTLPPEVRFAIATAKNTLKANLPLAGFGNQRGNAPTEGSPLPKPDQACDYVEFDVGQDRQGQRGLRRLVFEVHRANRQIREIYYTDEHYGKGTFVRVV